MIKIGCTERGDAGLDLTWADKMGEVDGAIVITKNPTPEFIDLVKEHKDKLIAHVTITGHGGTVYEPNIPAPGEIYPLFHEILDILGPRKTVLRIDPIIPTPAGTDTALGVFISQRMLEHRTRISILDYYLHVNQRFLDARVPILPYRFHESYTKRENIISRFPNAEICSEPGFSSNGCVSHIDLDALNIPYTADDIKAKFPQRKHCTCIGNKVELLVKKAQCPYKCLYCYWRSEK